MVPLAEDDPRRVGAYRLLGRLGEGGMGRVYLGRSVGGRAVALKVVHPRLASVPGFRQRFAREVRAARAVSGPGTVPVVAADPDGPVPWLAYAYVPGLALADAVHAYGALRPRTAWWLLAGLVSALGSVHDRGVVHRDLKPSNVLLTHDGPRLIDFGIARAADDATLTGTGMVVGSPGYLSPEQAGGGELTAASDVFSLGAVLVHAVTGHGPFGAGSAPELLYRVVHQEPELPDLPDGLAEIARRCLAKRPADRPLLADLREAVAAHADHRAALPSPVAAELLRRAEELLNLELAPLTRPSRPVAHTAVPTAVDPAVALAAEPTVSTPPADAVVPPFWFAVPVPRPLLSADGEPVAELAPGAWYLAERAHGDTLHVLAGDGRRGLLHDTDGIEIGHHGTAERQEQTAADEAQDAPRTPAPEAGPFWFAVPEHRPLLSEDGAPEPVAELAPGAWYLAVRARGDALEVLSGDGRRGLLHDTSRIQRGDDPR
ncbi:protein kinase [Streptomyces sp. DSM 44915]|uniref:Protein kinase n=1 Tax=Streptomyces chisholmiae TaxID=3075540 RepID=A0ABU2JVJ6_9ACTN|nr:protein kinase [Streptomyces sp. DSM 44915]MDT0268783.1 protein kinase [Streptomyces sp. DSM 44915]